MKPAEILDKRFERVLLGATLEHLCTGAIWSEGPVWIHEDDSVLWSDIPNNRILRWSALDGLSIWRSNAQFTNGHTRDLNGDLLHCSHGRRAIMRTPRSFAGVQSHTQDEVVVDRFEGRLLNSPNDLVVRSDGTIWFTDPPYGILNDREGYKAPQEQPANFIFCFDPKTSRLHAASSQVEEPNGLAFSPNEKILYVSDTSAAMRRDGSGNHHIVAFDVKGMQLSGMRCIAKITPGLPDGFRVDEMGWIYTSSEDSVQVLHPDGSLLGRIPVPEKIGNLTFGGPFRRQLFIAASTSLYRIELNTRGV